MSTFSNLSSIKYSGTQVAVARTTAGTSSYLVPAGKTLVGAWDMATTTNGASITIDGIKIADLAGNDFTGKSGPLYVNAGSTVYLSVANVGYCSIHGVLMENTP